MTSRTCRIYAGDAMNRRLAPLLRRPAVLDVGTAGLLAALALIFERNMLVPGNVNLKLSLAFGSFAAWRWHAVAWWVASAAGLAILPLRHRFPVIAFGVTLVMATAHSLLGFVSTPVDLAVAITVYTLASLRPRRTSLRVLIVGAVLAVIAGQAVAVATVAGPGQAAPPGDWLGKPADALAPALVVASAWFAGHSARTRRAYLAEVERRARDAERDHDRRAELAAAAERARITRELHDVIAHALSVIVIQAQGAGAALRRHQPEDTAGALDTIVATGRDALTETRRLLGVVRRTPAADLELGPQPDLAGLPELVSKIRQAGTPVALRVEGVPRLLEPGVELSAYRIIQEALTNTIKHGGPAAMATVSVRYGDDDLTLDVTDDGRGRRGNGHEIPADSHGLRGMRARVAMLGGELIAGPAAPCGFRVQARLPLQATPDREVPAR
jgi:signal transduction histidine kinase